MRIVSCLVKNFCSYEELEFNFENQGLTLIHGATGSGKSTLEDVPAWILFGITAKDGPVDDVINWYNSDSPTIGYAEVIVGQDRLFIHRIRGANQNDLFWTENDDAKQYRGKTLVETQSTLEQRLGVDSELYNAAVYFNEFSDTGNFFLAKAKDRRKVFDKIADLSFATKLLDVLSEKKSKLKPQINAVTISIANQCGRIEQSRINLKEAIASSKQWNTKQAALIVELTKKLDNFDIERNEKLHLLISKAYQFDVDKKRRLDAIIDKIDEIDERIKNVTSESLEAKIIAEERTQLTSPVCPQCKQSIKSTVTLEKLKTEKLKYDHEIEARNRYVTQHYDTNNLKNPYNDQAAQLMQTDNHYVEQLQNEKNKVNPFEETIVNLQADLRARETSLKADQQFLEENQLKLFSYDQLIKIAHKLRGAMVVQAVKLAENQINDILSRFFDSEFSVSFGMLDLDKMDVVIHRDGSQCYYTQLSKGQRQILKLSFVVALMRIAANEAGLKFSAIFFDEALDGLDVDLKLKAFSLFQELEQEYESIFVIDHSEELKLQFTNRYKVSLENGKSIIQKEA